MRTLLIAAVLLTAPTAALADPQARVTVLNFQSALFPTAPNTGLDDPTPVAPVGGNPGTTLGQQRLFALQFAADIWARSLRSHVEVFIAAAFGPRTCNATSAVLASTGTNVIDLNFKRAPQRDTWYHGALADAIAKTDLDPGFVDLLSIFNVNLGAANCFAGSPFYLGVDGNAGPTRVDVVTTALHEFAHGLGFSQFSNVSTGALLTLPGFPPLPDAYNRNIYDTTLGLTWDMMTNAQRQASAVNGRRVAWIGPHVTDAVPRTLAPGTPVMRVDSPGSIAGNYAIGTAAFGPPLGTAEANGQVAAAVDAVEASGTSQDGCSAISGVAGRIALIDRGLCGFALKAANAQAAGAIGVVIANNVAGFPPPPLGGVDPTIVIPVVSVTQADGALLRAHLDDVGGVQALLHLDLSTRAGATPDGLALLYTPTPVAPGSTISHWDTLATPNQLMEPAINADLTHRVGITLDLLWDLGWQVEKRQGAGRALGHQP